MKNNGKSFGISVPCMFHQYLVMQCETCALKLDISLNLGQAKIKGDSYQTSVGLVSQKKKKKKKKIVELQFFIYFKIPNKDLFTRKKTKQGGFEMKHGRK